MKRKFNLFLSVAMMCLCACAVVVGVYSVKNVTMSTKGTLSFTAHNTDIGLSGSIVACATSDANATTTKKFTVDNIGGKQSTYSLNLSEQFKDTTNTTGKMYFSDLCDNGKTITITLTVTNNSKYLVMGTAKAPSLVSATNCSMSVKFNNETLSASSTKEYYLAKTQTATMVITITLNSDASDVDATISGENLFTFDSAVKVLKYAELSATVNIGGDEGSKEVVGYLAYIDGMTWEDWFNNKAIFFAECEGLSDVTYDDTSAMGGNCYIYFGFTGKSGTYGATLDAGSGLSTNVGDLYGSYM